MSYFKPKIDATGLYSDYVIRLFVKEFGYSVTVEKRGSNATVVTPE